MQSISYNKIAGSIKNNNSANYISQARPFGDDVMNNNEIDKNNGLSMPIIPEALPPDGSILIFNGTGNDLVFADYAVPASAPSASTIKQVITWTYNNTSLKWEPSFEPLNLNPQKEVETDYVLLPEDDGYSIILNNGSNPTTVTVPLGLPTSFQVGFIQIGSGDIEIIGALGVTLNNAIGGYKIKGQYDHAFLEKRGVDETYYLLGNIKV
jgi:hypothetical protein